MKMTHAFLRLFSNVVVPVAFSLSFVAVGWAPMALDIVNAMEVFFGVLAFLVFSRRLYDTLVAPGPMEAQDFASLGLNDIFLYMILAGIWSVRATSGGHTGSILDDVGLRLTFRILAVRGLIYVVAAQGIDGVDRVPLARWLRLGALTLSALTVIAIINLAGSHIPAIRIPAALQDDAPSPQESHGAP